MKIGNVKKQAVRNEIKTDNWFDEELTKLKVSVSEQKSLNLMRS